MHSPASLSSSPRLPPSLQYKAEEQIARSTEDMLP